ncbi:MAG TPA: cytochrome b/b6 domain-containing protein [Rhodocyclaceae bacterium]|nr:cytochrome b/b6 domain-containing protein [Rhodocyclaceae bacterium]
MAAAAGPDVGRLEIHPLPVRVAHWINVVAVAIMVLSGWRIYNASPLFPFRFPDSLTLGGWLAGALQWHFAAMWLLAVNGLAYVAYGLLSGHYRRSFLPIRPRALGDAFANAVHGRLRHRVGEYNPLQRLAYVGAVVLLVLMVLSGLSIWKPVQFQVLAGLFGGYEGARLVHFGAMAAIVLFVAIHVVMVAIVPSTFLPMWTGRSARSRP